MLELVSLKIMKVVSQGKKIIIEEAEGIFSSPISVFRSSTYFILRIYTSSLSNSFLLLCCLFGSDALGEFETFYREFQAFSFLLRAKTQSTGGVMSAAQLKALAAVCRHRPDKPGCRLPLNSYYDLQQVD